MSQQINLFNPVFLKRKRHFSAQAMLQSLALVIAGSLAIYAYEVRQNRTLERVLADTDTQVSARRDQLLRFSKDFSEQGASRALGEELARTEARVQQRRALLGDVRTGAGGNSEGYSPFLTALARQTIQGVWLVGLDIGGKSNELRIKARALDSASVPVYIRSLNREAAMTGRRVAELEVSAKEAANPSADEAARGPSRYIEFSLSIPLGAASEDGKS